MHYFLPKLKFNIFNPNEIVSKYDPKKMLMNEGTDMNHYSDFGEKVIGEYYQVQSIKPSS